MKHQLPKFSVPMPCNAKQWPFKDRSAAVVCNHSASRRYFVDGMWRCADCRDIHTGKVIAPIA